MYKVGSKDVILSQTILIPAGDDAWITASQSGDAVRMHFIVSDTLGKDGKPDPQAKPTLKVEGKGDHAVVTLLDWRSPLGATTAPLSIGRMNDKREIWIMVDCVRNPNVCKLIVQVMLGGAV